MAQVFFSIGTNIGDRFANLQQAVRRLGAEMEVTAVSPVYQTEPWGDEAQEAFLNICVAANTALEPRELLQLVKQIESDMGREPTRRWGPRLIDIDILFYDALRYDDEALTIPHPYIVERAFVLVPLADIAPDLVHPVNGRTVLEMRQAIDDSTVEQVASSRWQVAGEAIGTLGDEKQPISHSGAAPARTLHSPLPTPHTLFRWGERTYVMGIINATPDSFSGDGLLAGEQRGHRDSAIRIPQSVIDRTVAQALAFVADGADILDVGGESTRPGSKPVTAEEELARVIPVIKAIRQATDAIISVDTYRAAVAKAALEAGADWVNDVWGLRMDAEMAPLVAAVGCPVVIMHNRSRPKDAVQAERLGGYYQGVEYDDLIADVVRELQESVDRALAAGIRKEQIIVDPGIGFGKTPEQNLVLLNGLDALKQLGYPILLGTSRKSFIGRALDATPDDRLEGTAATVAIGIDRGADIVRVHDVRAMVRVARMTDAIVRWSKGAEG